MVVSARVVALAKLGYDVLGRKVFTWTYSSCINPGSSGRPADPPRLKAILNIVMVNSAAMLALLTPPPHGASTVGG